MFRPFMLAIFRLYMKTYQVDLAPPPYPLKTTHICLYNYLISVHVQPEDGQHHWPKHVVVPNVENT